MISDAGFDTVPARHPATTAALVAAVVAASAAFAHGFKLAAEWALDTYGGSQHSTAAAHRLAPLAVGIIVVVAVLVSAELAKRAARLRPDGSGLEAIAASARGERRRISVVATLHRATGIWLNAAGLVSIGRETAIIETGGALGSVVGRKSGGKGDSMAVAGIAAAFAAAYHAPLAATIYVEEHLRVRRSRRAIRFTVAGAVGGHLVSIWLLGGHAVFPAIEGSRWALLTGGLAVTLPAAIAARIFIRVRTIASDDTGWRARWGPKASPSVRMGCALVAGATVAIAPWAAGNGMDPLRAVPVTASFTLAGALLIAKTIGTTAALAAGAPGGIISPSMAIAGGGALTVALAIDRVGLDVSNPWDLVVAGMVVGVAVGLRSPLMAPVMVAELLGDYTLVPALAVVAVAAHGLDRAFDALVKHFGAETETLDEVHDEDG
ncbi:MAG: chloride channel protein [Desertimonas sp.]